MGCERCGGHIGQGPYMASLDGLRNGPCTCGPTRPPTEGEAADGGLNDHNPAFPSPFAQAAPRGFPHEASDAQASGDQSTNLNLLRPPPGTTT
eukprot:9288422-Pyramimonas_sp.AAC.1